MRKIVHLQFGTTPSGNYTMRTHEAFLTYGFDSKVLSLHSSISGDSRVTTVSRLSKVKAKLNLALQNFLLRNQDRRLGYFNHAPYGVDISDHSFVREADFVYVHWVLGGFLFLNSLRRLAQLKKPIIIVLHDMWGITGGCSYSFDCIKFESGCGNCPQLPGDKHKDFSYFQYREKLRLFQDFSNIFFVTPSAWMESLAERSGLTSSKYVKHIPNPIDLTLFKPFSKEVAKRILNLDPKIPVVSFGANSVTSPYKGWKHMKESMELLHTYYKGEVVLIVFGSSDKMAIESSFSYKVKFMGFISDDYTTNLVYNASDVFVAPSLADNLPTTILESLACGTAVVGFNTGGIPEMVVHKKNGYLANYKDSDDLARGIAFCISNHLEGGLSDDYQPSHILAKHEEFHNFINQLGEK